MKKLNLTKRAKGFALSSELIFLSTIVTAGLSVGMVTVRDAVVSEMSDVGQAIGSLSQSYEYNGIINGASSATVEGSGYVDEVDLLAGDGVGWIYIDAAAEDGATNTNGTTGADAVAGTGGTLL